MTKLFGTDGIRGKANQDPITAERAVRIGKAIAVFFQKENAVSRILLAKDSRISGDMLEAGLAAGILSMGADAVVCGILPTPGVAWLTVAEKAAAGISVSASHNPYDDNGIKIFGADGFKLSNEKEERLEALILKDLNVNSNSEIGRVCRLRNSTSRYRDFLASKLPWSPPAGIKIVIDCANGATSRIAPALFTGRCAQAEILFCSPNGKNINARCGSEHPERLKSKVIENKADIGIAFDGDGDRVIAVDEHGEVLSGDELLAILAEDVRRTETFSKMPVVSTVMSNIGLGIALKQLGFQHIMTDVGDRHVVEKMKAAGAVLGGENSGHLIFLDHHTTGDGMLSALQLLRILQSKRKPLSELRRIITLFPQILMNVPVRRKPEIETIPAIALEIQSVEEKLGEKGRVLVRYSGTEPLCRVMVEGPSRPEIDAYCRRIAGRIHEALGG